MNKEPEVIIPEGVGKKSNIDSGYIIYLPKPNTEDEGLYISQADLVKLLRANKHNPEAIQYIADMLE